MFGTKSWALIVLGCSQLPAELAVCRQAVGEASLGAEVYLPSGLGRTARWAFLEPTPQPLRVLPWGTPGEGSVTCHRRDRRGVPGPRAGVETASSSFVQPASGPPPSGTEPQCQPLRPVNACILPGWLPPIVPCSHSSMAPYCPIGSFINIWLGPLCRLCSPPLFPKVLPVLSQAFVVLSLGCRTLCPP